MASSTPTLDALKDQIRAAVAEIDTAVAQLEEVMAASKIRLAELASARKPLAAALGEAKPTRAPGTFICECGHRSPSAQGLKAHRTRSHKQAATSAAPPVAPLVAEPGDAGERDVLRLWDLHRRDSADRRIALIADATGRRADEVRHIVRRLGLTASPAA